MLPDQEDSVGELAERLAAVWRSEVGKERLLGAKGLGDDYGAGFGVDPHAKARANRPFDPVLFVLEE